MAAPLYHGMVDSIDRIPPAKQLTPAWSGNAVASRVLPPPTRLLSQLPLADPAAVHASRSSVTDVLAGDDDRLLVIVGPCSIHDPVAGLDYAGRLGEAARTLAADLLIVMRAYLEKPRTVGGWRGLVADPHLDGSCDVPEGLSVGRRFLLDVSEIGLPVAVEYLDPLFAPYLADAVSWGCIGARTVTSQPHRQLASWLPMPVGFKNSVDGDVRVAVDAIRAAATPQSLTTISTAGQPVVLRSTGNPTGHVVLRGGTSKPNYDKSSVSATIELLARAGLPQRVVVDASHGNSRKDHRIQPAVVADLAGRIQENEPGLMGVMIESFLRAGRQNTGSTLKYGVSITDSCASLATTVELLEMLAEAVRERREQRSRESSCAHRRAAAAKDSCRRVRFGG